MTVDARSISVVEVVVGSNYAVIVEHAVKICSTVDAWSIFAIAVDSRSTAYFCCQR